MRWTLVLLALGACGDSQGQPDASMTDGGGGMVDASSTMPMTLAETGLCADAACTQINAGIRAYKPRFELWSDTAAKRRWIYLPPGTKIDTADMDFWQFPVGTKLWKEFSRDGVRVETRLVMRIGSGDTVQDWFYGGYVWNAAQDATTLENFGVTDANGTQHDVPNRSQCRQCHEAVAPSRVLGFSAIQLDYDNPVDGELDLPALVASDLLTAPPSTGQTAGTYFPLPGTATESAALGYLHANCGHCHNPKSPTFMNVTPLNVRLTVGTLGSLATTPTYQTAVDVSGMPVNNLTKIIDPTRPNMSILNYRFESTNAAVRMPALGSEIIDDGAATVLRDWVSNM